VEVASQPASESAGAGERILLKSFAVFRFHNKSQADLFWILKPDKVLVHDVALELEKLE